MKYIFKFQTSSQPLSNPFPKRTLFNGSPEAELLLSGFQCPGGTVASCKQLRNGVSYIGTTITKCNGMCLDKPCSFPCVCICKDVNHSNFVRNPVIRHRGMPATKLPTVTVLRRPTRYRITIIPPSIKQMILPKRRILFPPGSGRPVPQCAVPHIAKCTAKLASEAVDDFCAQACRFDTCPLVCDCLCPANMISSPPVDLKSLEVTDISQVDPFVLSIISEPPTAMQNNPGPSDVPPIESMNPQKNPEPSDAPPIDSAKPVAETHTGVISPQQTWSIDSATLLGDKSNKPFVVLHRIPDQLTVEEKPIHQDIRGIRIEDTKCPAGEILQCDFNPSSVDPKFDSNKCICVPNSPCNPGEIMECRPNPTQADLSLLTKKCWCSVKNKTSLFKTAVLSSFRNEQAIPEAEVLLLQRISKTAIPIPEKALLKAPFILPSLPGDIGPGPGGLSRVAQDCQNRKQMFWCDPTEVWLSVPGIFKWCNINCESEACDIEICQCRCVSEDEHQLYYNLFITKAPYFQPDKTIRV